MKRPTLILLFLLLVFSSFQSSTTRTANVEPVNGIYIYFHSRPAEQYDYLDTYTIQIAMTGKPEELINMMLNKVRKKYPEANGIIITSDELDQCDIIKLK